MRTQERTVARPTPQGRRQNQPRRARRKSRTQASGSSGWRARLWATSAACSVSSETKPVRPRSRKRSTAPEAAGDGGGGHPLAGQAQGIAQGGPQQRAGEPIGGVGGTRRHVAVRRGGRNCAPKPCPGGFGLEPIL